MACLSSFTYHSLHLIDFAPDKADHSHFPACALVIHTSAPPDRLSLLPIIQPDLQIQPRESYVFQKLAQLALALGSLPETIRHLPLKVVDPPCFVLLSTLRNLLISIIRPLCF